MNHVEFIVLLLTLFYTNWKLSRAADGRYFEIAQAMKEQIIKGKVRGCSASWI